MFEKFNIEKKSLEKELVDGKLSNDEKLSHIKKIGELKILHEKLHEKLNEEFNKNDAVNIPEEIENKTFMPKLLGVENAVIPNYVYLKELKRILENASKYSNLRFLIEKDEESGYTYAEMIEMLFKFRIPFYVGPTIKDSSYSWIIRKENEEKGLILPWNLENKIDIKKTREEFIKRLIRKCTYIKGEKVLPKNSLLYEKFSVLNEINNIHINGIKINEKLKQDIFDKLFKKNKKVTKSKLIKYLITHGYLKDKNDLFGLDKEINNSLTSYNNFKEIFDDINDKNKEEIEEIIKICTIYSSDKKELIKILKEKYLEKKYLNLNEDKIKKITNFKIEGWGKLSKNFLEL